MVEKSHKIPQESQKMVQNPKEFYKNPWKRILILKKNWRLWMDGWMDGWMSWLESKERRLLSGADNNRLLFTTPHNGQFIDLFTSAPQITAKYPSIHSSIRIHSNFFICVSIIDCIQSRSLERNTQHAGCLNSDPLAGARLNYCRGQLSLLCFPAEITQLSKDQLR